jgi:membrane associated rhomboid family serine protease
MAWRSTWNDPPRQPGFFVDRGGLFPPGVKLILILTVAVFILSASDLGNMRGLLDWGSLSVMDLAHLEVWRLVTYMFLHASGTHILVNMFMFWMLGVALERQMGTKPFLKLYFACGVVGGLFEVAFNLAMFFRFGSHAGDAFLTMPAVGASAGVMGILVAFATLNPRVTFLLMFLLPVEAWWVAVIYGVLETWPVVQDLFINPKLVWSDNVAHAAHFGGMVVGFAWIKMADRIARWMRPAAATRTGRTFVERPPDEEEAELDRILDKIHREGLGSLTLKERMFLQEISRKRRGEGP